VLVSKETVMFDWLKGSPPKLNLFLLRCAAEDAAQQAIGVEIQRQLAAQGLPSELRNIYFDIEIPLDRANVDVGGRPAIWTEEPI
jgi:hypothetical protein